MAKTLSFADAKAHKTKEAVQYHMEVLPEEIGLELTPDEMGVDENGKPNKSVCLTFRPLTRDEYNDILVELRDEKDTIIWQDEKDFAVVSLCLVEPEIPPTAEGRKFLESWLPGTLANVRQQIEERSGYRRGGFVVEKASEAMRLLGKRTSAPTSTSK